MGAVSRCQLCHREASLPRWSSVTSGESRYSEVAKKPPSSAPKLAAMPAPGRLGTISSRSPGTGCLGRSVARTWLQDQLRKLPLGSEKGGEKGREPLCPTCGLQHFCGVSGRSSDRPEVPSGDAAACAPGALPGTPARGQSLATESWQPLGGKVNHSKNAKDRSPPAPAPQGYSRSRKVNRMAHSPFQPNGVTQTSQSLPSGFQEGVEDAHKG
ncbi:uncharacterized protein LOC116423066 [Sarcophilus harrisii]|uniref:uncharacterized protein LOC116423066 n=1 Tax=Sarcophilus harrisii TaxID=9305 RepID=UPI001301F360|nr:uncharacterized protein LOC116423066 [Sarcophilus harrisii]